MHMSPFLFVRDGNMNVNKERLCAFTDGIAAIAATIMVLNLGLPDTDDWSGLLSQGNVLLAYIVSYMLIYLVWYMHHSLFAYAGNISVKVFLINGLWLLILTLVPFTTGWVGKAAGRIAAPRVVYSLNILLWALAFSWLEHQVVKENPDVPWDNPSRAVDRRIMYGGFSVCFALSFILRDGVVPLTGIVTVIMLVRALRTGGRRIKEKKKS